MGLGAEGPKEREHEILPRILYEWVERIVPRFIWLCKVPPGASLTQPRILEAHQEHAGFLKSRADTGFEFRTDWSLDDPDVGKS